MARPFQVNTALTAIAIGYRNPASAYIADAAMPRHPVSLEKFGWTEYPIEEAFNVPDGRVSRLGRVPQLEFGGTQREASVEDFGFDVPIPNSDIDTAAKAREMGLGNFDPEGHAVASATDTLLNIREVRVAGMVQNPLNYSVGRRIQLAQATDKFSDYANSDPIGVITKGMDSTLVMRPTDAFMGRDVWSKISSHPKMVNAVKGNVTSQGRITPEQFVEVFAGDGLQRLHIGDSFFNTAKPGQPVALSRAWGKSLALLHVNPLATPQMGGITWGLTGQYGTRLAGRIIDEDVGLQGGVRVRTGERVKELVVAKDVGYLIQDAVQ
ncbi:hypothetical protein [uncultured Sphingomonas sp.]|uniref:hypothetical protein n=1 Tax=uncultured Sphingomonas sp. TaxID=158754 RepID=UPI002583AEAD|nr:hypothetical protein [uncultured Sphingomonas sp.]